MEPIQIIGIDLLDDMEKATVNKLANEYYKKIQREIKNEVALTIHIKEHTKGGKSKKTDIRVKVSAPTKIFEAQESDWDFAKAFHKVFENVLREIQHSLHTDNQKPKSYG